MASTRIGDGLAVGADVLAAAQRAATAALAALGGAEVDLAFVFVSGAEPLVTAAALQHAAQVLQARTVVGCTAHGVIGAGRGVEIGSAVSVWAAALPDVTLRAFHLEVIRTSESIAVLGMPTVSDQDVAAVLLADPWSFPADGFIANAEQSVGPLPVVGGLASGATGAGQTRLLLDEKVYERGAVGVLIGGSVEVHPLVSQGCRPIGQAYTVTEADGPVIGQIAGWPALQRAQQAVAALPQEEQALAVRGLQLGIAMNEYTDAHGPGDFLARPISSAESEGGAIEVGDAVPVGSTVQFLLRDADAATADLDRVLAQFRGSKPQRASNLAGALVFSCNGRGRAMFPTADHDVAAIRTGLGIEAAAGFFAAGEFGPVAGRNYLHGFTASLLVFESD